MMSKDATFWYTVLLFSSFILMGIAWITFARLTMARIERDIKKGGLSASFLWDGLGGRIVFYALAIVLSTNKAQRINQLIDVSLVRKYANRGDWHRGLIFLLTSNCCLILIFVGVLSGAYQG